MLKISIIIPIHNTLPEYLDSCLKSIFSQSLEEFELICVDDCSDNIETIDCLNHYKTHIFDKKMKIIQLDKSVGAAKARNYGLENATGEYVIFLDSDDVFHVDMLSIMYKNIKKKQADVCICNYKMMYKDGHYLYFDNYELNKTNEDWLCKIPMNPWTKLIRRKYLIENDICFQSLTSCNDVYFSVMTVLCTNNLVYLNDKYLVDYRVGTPGNISTSRNPLNIWYAFDELREKISKRFDDYDFHILDATLLNSCICELNLGTQEENKKKLYENCKHFLKDKKMSQKHLERQRKYFIEFEYETKWFEHIGDYIVQLRYNSNRILRRLGCKELWLFGIGERGKAFLQWAHENNIKLQGICDKRNDKCGEIINGIKIFSREDVLKKENITIIASNDAVYEELNHICKEDLINLEAFCPL